MERRVLDAFANDKKFGERVHCTAEALETLWLKAWQG